MTRTLPIAILSAIAAMAIPGAASAQTGACSINSMPQSQKDALLAEYVRLKRTAGQASADAFVKAQGIAYRRKLEASGVCPRGGDAPAPPPVAQRSDDPPLLNRFGKRCTRIEMENQNVPNIGGAMGWALIPVCKD